MKGASGKLAGSSLSRLLVDSKVSMQESWVEEADAEEPATDDLAGDDCGEGFSE